jgi:hypothetical protein
VFGEPRNSDDDPVSVGVTEAAASGLFDSPDPLATKRTNARCPEGS